MCVLFVTVCLIGYLLSVEGADMALKDVVAASKLYKIPTCQITININYSVLGLK